MRIRSFIIVLAAALLLAGCTTPQPELSSSPASVPTPSASPTPSPMPAPLALTVEAVADPSLLATDMSDPYDTINRYNTEIFSPDKALYNALYKAVAEQEASMDISAYDLTYKQKYQTASCLFGEFQFYYLYTFKLSKNGDSIKFIYKNASNAAENDETFAARLGQLLYNTAPEDGTDIQKFMAVYEYICEAANYSHDMTDSATITPYSIIMNGEGICSGYAVLFEYVLNHLGIPVEYASNDSHAWNIVKLGNDWYQTDLTWGAGGYGDTFNNTFTLLMDDKTRLRTLQGNGLNTSGICIGFPGEETTKMPACTSTRFSDYKDVGCVYAFDIADNCVYYNGSDGISCMDLDCSNKKTLLNGIYAVQMLYFDGALYYIDMDTCYLYKLIPGKSPGLLDDSGIIVYLSLDGTNLSYGQLEPDEKSIPLLSYDAADYSTADTNVFPSAKFPRSRTFRFLVKFSEPVDAGQDWNQRIYLADKDGHTIPLHFSLSEDAITLTINPAVCIADAGTASLCISKDITSANGIPLAAPCRMDVSIKSSAETPNEQ